MFHNMNANKRMITVDPANPQGRELVLDLVRWADVVTESFTPRAMRGWDLTWETIHEVNPRAIMMSSCLMGQSGPLAEFAGFGNLAAAFAGFTPLCGWSDRAPAGPFGAYTDYVAPRFATAALLAALDERDRTGRGQYIDVSQLEAAIHFLTPALLQYLLTGEQWSPNGNDDPQMSPHGVFPSEGEDRWVAVACRDDATARRSSRYLPVRRWKSGLPTARPRMQWRRSRPPASLLTRSRPRPIASPIRS